jgi:hypothetical protein
VNIASSTTHINSISLSALELLVSVRLMPRLRCSVLFSALLSLRCVPSPTIVSGADSVASVSLHEIARDTQTS